MPARSLGRATVLQSLYEWDFNNQPESDFFDIVERNLVDFAPGMKDPNFVRELANLILKNKEAIDNFIRQFAPDWPLEKITTIDRNILRIGVAELKFNEDVPPKVAINEAIELGKTYGGESSGKFINGVLGSIYRLMKPEEGKTNKDKKLPSSDSAHEVAVKKT